MLLAVIWVGFFFYSVIRSREGIVTDDKSSRPDQKQKQGHSCLSIHLLHVFPVNTSLPFLATHWWQHPPPRPPSFNWLFIWSRRSCNLLVLWPGLVYLPTNTLWRLSCIDSNVRSWHQLIYSNIMCTSSVYLCVPLSPHMHMVNWTQRHGASIEMEKNYQNLFYSRAKKRVFTGLSPCRTSFISNHFLWPLASLCRSLGSPQVRAWTLTGPWQHFNYFCFQPSCCRFTAVLGIIVMLYDPSLPKL